VTSDSLHIAWLGAGPARRESGGVPGVATELLDGLGRLGHRVDCFIPSDEHPLPSRLLENVNVSFVWGPGKWRWGRWYSRWPLSASVTYLASRSLAEMRLRRQIRMRHARDPYDVIYQFSNIETLSLPARMARTVPLVIHPELHTAGELRFLLAERRLSLRSQPRHKLLVAAAILWLRTPVQKARIRRAKLLICISSVFREHLVRDYRFPRERTVIVPNPVRLERFASVERGLAEPPTVLVLGRVAVRKGIDDVVAVARALHEQDVDVRVRVIGGPGQWSDYTKLLEDLPPANAEYGGRRPGHEVPAELARADVLLQASKYEPFALTVAEALAAGVPVVATSEVGAIDGVDRTVVSEVRPGDVEGMAAAIVQMLERLRSDAPDMRRRARTEAERLFAPEAVCTQIAAALEQLVQQTPTPAPQAALARGGRLSEG